MLLLAAPVRAGEPDRISLSDPSVGDSTEGRFRPSVSGDGRYVAFDTLAPLLPEDADATSDVYLFDRKTRRLELIASPDPDGMNGGAVISEDGRVVAFHSFHRPKDKNEGAVSDIVVFHRRQRRAYTITRAPHRGQAYFPRLGPDGRYVLFTTNAPDFGPRREPPVRAIFLFDRNRWTNQLLSRSAAGEPANRPSAEPRMDRSARYVGFISVATNLLPGRSIDELSPHLFLLDRVSGRLTQVDEFERGLDPKEWVVSGFAMDGRGENLVVEVRHRSVEEPEAGLEKTDLFLFERGSGQARLITTGLFANRAAAPALSANGQYLAFVFRGVKDEEEGERGLVVYNRAADLWRLAAQGVCRNPAISADGSTIVYEAEEAVVVKGKERTVTNIFLVTNPFLEP